MPPLQCTSLEKLDLANCARIRNASSDAYRYYIMRNRALIKQYYRANDFYRSLPFGVGTVATFAKELIRLVVVERTLRGTSHLFRGLRDGRAIGRDSGWMPMPALSPTLA